MPPDNGVWFSARKKCEVSSYEKTRKNLKCILLRERSPSEKTTCWMIPTLMFWKKAEVGEQTEGCGHEG